MLIFRLLRLALVVLATAGSDANFFPYSQGWLGGDAAYSIPLDRSTTLWLFGDTFTGKRREPRTMIHNSIAIRRCKAEACTVSYWWSGRHARQASSFFKTPRSDYYWPLDGFVYQRKLYIFLEEMHATASGGAFGFDYSGVVLATVSNFAASPAQWHITYQTISTGNAVVPGIATVIQVQQQPKDGYLYLFTLFRKSAQQPFVGLMRLPLDDLAAAGIPRNWQYLARESQWLNWKRATSPGDAWRMLDGNITEMSVKFHADSQRWIALYPTPGFLSNTASYSTASQLAGPWSQARPLFKYPEMQKEDARYTPEVFCYAAKEHPELETRGEFAFTYACNSAKESEILRDMRLYRPELVRMTLASDERQPAVTLK